MKKRNDSHNDNKNNNKTHKSALEVGAAYLASRMRTVAEVEKHLAGKDYAQAEIQEAVDELVAHKYLDDYAYAVRYYEYSMEKRRGSRRAMRELEEKGVDRNTIRNAYEDFVYENGVDEYQEALAVAEKELYVIPDTFGGDYSEELVMKPVDDKLLAKIGRKLESRGFKNDDIYRVLSEIRSRAR